MNSSPLPELSPLQTAMSFKKLVAFGWSARRIAQTRKVTEPYVKGMLLLANANIDVQQMVENGSVPPARAVEAIRRYGERAGRFLLGTLHPDDRPAAQALEDDDEDDSPLAAVATHVENVSLHEVHRRVQQMRQRIVDAHFGSGKPIVILPTNGGAWADLMRDLAIEAFQMGRASVIHAPPEGAEESP